MGHEEEVLKIGKKLDKMVAKKTTVITFYLCLGFFILSESMQPNEPMTLLCINSSDASAADCDISIPTACCIASVLLLC